MKKIYKIHSWLGLFNGCWLLILGISGSLLVYYHEIDRYVNKEQLTVTPRNYKLPIDSLVSIVKKRVPNARGTNILHFPTSPTDTYEFRVYIQDGSKKLIHWWETYNIDINPYNGQILREGYYRDIHVSFMNWLLNLHWSLHFGPIGELIIAIAGILIFINIVTGLIIYKKYILKVFLFRAPFKWSNWRTVGSGLHRYLGVWSLFFNLLIFYSGVQMNWSAFKSNTWKPPIVMPQSTKQYYAIDSLQKKVQSIYPGFVTHYLYIPFINRRFGKEMDEVISFQGYIPGTPSIVPESASKIDFDPYSGKLIKSTNINEQLAKMNYWDKFNEIVYSFHVGSFAGNISRILYVFIGLTPAILSITGFMLWWRRRYN
jgi:uncharacterized iron-regulated membrane protein